MNFPSLEIRNMLGKLIKTGKLDENSVNLSNLQSGVYFI
ncbi:MAG: T9SS type A sorting domain-containing protein [Psychroflexus sp.]